MSAVLRIINDRELNALYKEVIEATNQTTVTAEDVMPWAAELVQLFPVASIFQSSLMWSPGLTNSWIELFVSTAIEWIRGAPYYVLEHNSAYYSSPFALVDSMYARLNPASVGVLDESSVISFMRDSRNMLVKDVTSAVRALQFGFPSLKLNQALRTPGLVSCFIEDCLKDPTKCPPMLEWSKRIYERRSPLDVQTLGQRILERGQQGADLFLRTSQRFLYYRDVILGDSLGWDPELNAMAQAGFLYLWDSIGTENRAQFDQAVELYFRMFGLLHLQPQTATVVPLSMYRVPPQAQLFLTASRLVSSKSISWLKRVRGQLVRILDNEEASLFLDTQLRTRIFVKAVVSPPMSERLTPQQAELLLQTTTPSDIWRDAMYALGIFISITNNPSLAWQITDAIYYPLTRLSLAFRPTPDVSLDTIGNFLRIKTSEVLKSLC